MNLGGSKSHQPPTNLVCDVEKPKVGVGVLKKHQDI